MVFLLQHLQLLHEDAEVVGHAFRRQRHRFTVTLPDDEPELDEIDEPCLILLNKNGIGSASASAAGSANPYAND